MPGILNATPSLTLPVTNGEAVNTMTASQSPTSWAITGCSASCSGYFAVDNSGNVTITSSGVTNLVAGTYTLSLTATNGSGTSAPGTDTIALNAPAVPVISNATASLVLPLTNGEAVNTMTATNSPTGWAITGCSPTCTGYFAIDSSGHVTVTSTGVSNIVASNTPGPGTLLTGSRDASANWAMAGLQPIGGIPTRSTVCATLSPVGGGADDSAQINSAITACPDHEVVALNAGTFTVTGGNSVTVNKDVTLRGAGAGSTYLQKAPGTSTTGYPCTSGAGGATLGSGCPGTNPSSVVKMGGSAALTATSSLTADAAKGATSITVASATGFTVGGLVHIDELAIGASEPDCCFNSGTGSVWAEPDMRVTWNAHNPTVQYYDNSLCFTSWGGGTANNFSCDTNGDACAYSIRCGGVTEELHLITNIVGNVIYF